MRRGIVIILVLLILSSAGCLGIGTQSAGESLEKDVGEASGRMEMALSKMAMEEAEAPSLTPAALEQGAEKTIALGEDVAGEEVIAPKIIFTGTIDLEVEDFDPAYSEITSIISSSGGYISQSNVIVTPAGKKRGTLTIRVPQGEFETLIDTLSGIGVVTSQNINSEDVTLEYTDLSSRVINLKETEKRLLALLDKAQNVSDILLIEKEITRVRVEIERIQGRLNYLGNKVDFATLTIIIHEHEPIEPEPVEYRAKIDVDDFDKEFDRISTAVQEAGGYLTNVKIDEYDNIKFGRFSINVPQNKFDDIKDYLEASGEVSDQSLKGVPSTESTSLNAVFFISMDEKESLLKSLSGLGDEFTEALREAIYAFGYAVSTAIVALGSLLPLLILTAIGYAVLSAVSKKEYFIWLVVLLSFVFIENGGWIIILILLANYFNKKVLQRKKKKKK